MNTVSHAMASASLSGAAPRPLAASTAARPSPAHPIQLHADAHNALATALHYLRQPTANVPGAARKTLQALTALHELFLLDVPDAASTAAQAQQAIADLQAIKQLRSTRG